jgi:hypothetical protein
MALEPQQGWPSLPVFSLSFELEKGCWVWWERHGLVVRMMPVWSPYCPCLVNSIVLLLKPRKNAVSWWYFPCRRDWSSHTDGSPSSVVIIFSALQKEDSPEKVGDSFSQKVTQARFNLCPVDLAALAVEEGLCVGVYPTPCWTPTPFAGYSFLQVWPEA